MAIPPTIICVECGGEAARLSPPPPEPPEGPTVVSYVCPDCGQRFDLVFEEEDADDGLPGGGAASGPVG